MMQLLSKFKFFAYQLSERFFDWRLGIKTQGLVMPSDFGEGAEGCHAYLALSYPGLRRIFSHLSLKPGVDVFVDIGSGLGRVVFYAANFNFKRCIGVEYSDDLHQKALANLKNARPKQCKDMQFYQGDARTYAIPDDATIFYFFMPFSAEILKIVLNNIHQSTYHVKREITILYAYPEGGAVTLHSVLPVSPWLTIKKELRVSKNLNLMVATIN